MFLQYLLLAIFLTIAVIGDLQSYRISNILVLSALAAGFVINGVTGGLKGLAWSFLACMIPAVLLFAFFALRMLGAGDIKLFCAIGSIMGVPFILYAMAFSFLAGGIIAAITMLSRGNVKQRAGYFINYLKNCFLTQSLPPYTDFDNKADRAKFHFSPAIAAGCAAQTLITLLSH